MALVQRLANHRLVGTAFAPKGALRPLVRSDSRIDLDHPLPTRQNVDERIQQFLQRGGLSHLACQILTEALLKYDQAGTEHSLQAQMVEILTAMNRVSNHLKRLRRINAQPVPGPSPLSCLLSVQPGPGS